MSIYFERKNVFNFDMIDVILNIFKATQIIY